jgi:hypothetical protein
MSSYNIRVNQQHFCEETRENHKPRQKKVYMVHMLLHDQIISGQHARFLRHIYLEARDPKIQQRQLNCSKLIHHFI